MKGMINSNPLNFEELRHKLKVQRVAARLHSITTGHEFVQQTVAQIYKIPRHNDFEQAPLAQSPSGENKERPPLTMEPSIDDPLAATTVTPAKAGVQRENMDSRLRGNDGMLLRENKLEELDGMLG